MGMYDDDRLDVEAEEQRLSLASKWDSYAEEFIQALKYEIIEVIDGETPVYEEDFATPNASFYRHLAERLRKIQRSETREGFGHGELETFVEALDRTNA
jgi:hypothetical protein